MRGLSLPLTLGVSILAAGIIFLDGPTAALSLFFFAYASIASWTAAREPAMECARTLSRGNLERGETSIVTISLRNAGEEEAIVQLAERLPEGLDVVEGDQAAAFSLSPGETASFSYEITAKRGSYRFPRIHTLVEGWLPRGGVDLETGNMSELLVFPALKGAPESPFSPRRTLSYVGLIPAGRAGTGMDFLGVRPFRPGDRLGHVDQRASARRDEPYIIEFERLGIADLAFILDMREEANPLGEGGESVLELSIEAELSLAEACLSRGDRVCHMGYGSPLEWVGPGYGRRQLERVRAALAKASPSGAEAFMSLGLLPGFAFPPSALIALFSPLLPRDAGPIAALRARGREVVVISPDPVAVQASTVKPCPELSAAAALARAERRALIGLLESRGILTISWAPERPFAEALAEAIPRLWAWKRGRGRTA